MSLDSSRYLRAKTPLGVCPLFAPNRSLRFCNTPTFHSALLQNLLRGRGVLMRVCVALSLSLLLVGLCSAQTPHAAIRKDLNVPAEDLSPALQQVATTYEIQLLYPTPLTKDLKTHGAVGSLTADDALTKVLSGTGLSYKYLDANTVTVFATAAPAAAAQDQTNQTQDKSQEAGKKSSQDFRVAQVAQGQTPSPSTVERADEQSSEKKKEQLQEVVVTGSRIPTPAGQQAEPVRSYSREEIETSGRTTVADFLNTLPDVSVASTESGIQRQGGQTTVQLHGLPVGTTLVLLNGRRVETSYNGFFDLSNLPANAIERIDVLPVGASAIYGSDALGGAVNIILRNNMQGLEVNAKYGGAVGTDETDANIGWGKAWDRASFSIIGNLQTKSALLGGQRSVTSDTTVPSGAPTFGIQDDCDPGTVYSVDGTPLPGLGSATQAGIPGGQTGKPPISSFVPSAGKVNHCNFLDYQSLIPKTTREGVFMSAHFSLTDRTELFSEVIFAHEDTDNRSGNLIDLPSYL